MAHCVASYGLVTIIFDNMTLVQNQAIEFDPIWAKTANSESRDH